MNQALINNDEEKLKFFVYGDGERTIRSSKCSHYVLVQHFQRFQPLLNPIRYAHNGVVIGLNDTHI